MADFWAVTLCGLVDGYQSFGGTYFLQLSTLKMEEICSSETLSTYKSTRRQNPEDRHGHIRRRENSESHIELLLFVSFFYRLHTD
jgi:hypothetical protein